MPCNKKMVQESKSAPPPSLLLSMGISGALLVHWPGMPPRPSALSLSVQVHNGDGAISDWLENESVSHVVQMLCDSFRAPRYIEMSLFVLNRYFLTKPMLMKWKECSAQAPDLLYVITRAKKIVRLTKDLGRKKNVGAALSMAPRCICRNFL